MSTNKRDPVANQLVEWKKKNKNNRECRRLTNSEGVPLETHDTSITVGPDGPICLLDAALIEMLANFPRERIPERGVHAKGAGAYGYFECTADITDLTMANMFESIGKKTPIFVRFSSILGNLGGADTVRDGRGFAIKFYTEDGNYDLVGNNTPLFVVRDPKLFPSAQRSAKRNPVTNTADNDMTWDFISLNPQTTHQILFLFSDRGIPDGFRHMHGFGQNTFSLINKDNKLTYVKFNYLTDQGIKNIPAERATELAGEQPDYATRDLFNAIAQGQYPSWTLNIQTMTPEQVKTCPFNPFDVTKTWPHGDFPNKPVGKIVLNRNPTNHFAEVEQSAFDPGSFIPGIGPSHDRLLQARLFSYKDAQRYRLGMNSFQLPINSPVKWCNYLRDGTGTINNQGGAPNYFPNSFGGPKPLLNKGTWLHADIEVSGKLGYFNLNYLDDYTQPRIFVTKTLKEDKLNILIENLANVLKQLSANIRERALNNFDKVDPQFGRNIRAKIELSKQADL